MNKTGSAEMLNTKRNAHEGFTPVAVGLPTNAITPGYYVTKRRGAMGDRHGPLRHRTRALYFIAE